MALFAQRFKPRPSPMQGNTDPVVPPHPPTGPAGLPQVQPVSANDWDIRDGSGGFLTSFDPSGQGQQGLEGITIAPKGTWSPGDNQLRRPGAPQPLLGAAGVRQAQTHGHATDPLVQKSFQVLGHRPVVPGKMGLQRPPRRVYHMAPVGAG